MSTTGESLSDLVLAAQEQLWVPAELRQSDIEKLLGGLLSSNIDLGELYFQASRNEFWSLEDGIVRDAGFSTDRGVGVRAVSGEKTGFAYADDIMLPALTQATQAAKSITRQGQDKSVCVLRARGQIARYSAEDPIRSLDEAQKVDLLMRVEQEARRQDPRVEEVTVRLSASHDTCLIVATDGTLAGDVRPLVRLDVSVIVAQKGRKERGSSGGGGRFSLDWFEQEQRCMEFAREAVRIALVNLEAVDAPAGNMPVVLGAGWPGVLLHEAVGHGLEGDFNRKGSSAFSGKMGEQVASSLCTVVDNGTMENRRGSLSVDDEGEPTQCTTLIENGILTGYLFDKLNARLMNVASTGNGRRESYAHLPMPRMTNTYMLAGESDQEEIIASVDKGLYAVNFGGGQVDITSGQFVFSATEAYLIENGKVTAPVKGATIIGNGPEVMTRISMVGNDLKLDQGVGVCGKDGQSVPVGVGQPTLKIDEVVVGGTAA
ncbi:MAG: metalloprotease TldD [Pseudomonadales bacterium]|nr:metalloprotease TldD [Pseudomonadales bacterium]